MGREGKKVQEFRIYINSMSWMAVLRMTESFNFRLEVNELAFEGPNPKDLIHQAEVQLEGEAGLKWKPLILVEHELQDGRLIFLRLFRATGKGQKEIYRTWRFQGENEKEKDTWNNHEVDSFEIPEGSTPGARHGGPRLKHRELPYTVERWLALVRLDELLRDAQKAVAEKLGEIIQKGDVDAFLEAVTKRGSPALLFEEPSKERS